MDDSTAKEYFCDRCGTKLDQEDDTCWHCVDVWSRNYADDDNDFAPSVPRLTQDDIDEMEIESRILRGSPEFDEGDFII